MVGVGAKILIVEDDESILRLLQLELEHRSCVTRLARDGITALDEAERFGPDAIILDIMLPEMDGVEVLKQLREQGDQVPVVMLTARDTVMEKIYSLDHGADDYITKPFDVEELLARIGAILRRTQSDEIMRVSDLEMNTATREVRRGERRIELTPREYELLEFMLRNHRRVLPRDLILSQVWKQEFAVETNIVDVYIGYLRKKIDPPGEAPLIQTIRGVGYALRED